MNIPIYRAKKIDSNEYVIGYYFNAEIEKQHIIMKQVICEDDDFMYDNDEDEIDPLTLEIYDGNMWRKLSECNIRTDYEIDIISYYGYCNGWNAALTKDSEPPSAIYEQIKSNRSKDVDNE